MTRFSNEDYASNRLLLPQPSGGLERLPFSKIFASLNFVDSFYLQEARRWPLVLSLAKPFPGRFWVPRLDALPALQPLSAAQPWQPEEEEQAWQPLVIAVHPVGGGGWGGIPPAGEGDALPFLLQALQSPRPLPVISRSPSGAPSTQRDAPSPQVNTPTTASTCSRRRRSRSDEKLLPLL